MCTFKTQFAGWSVAPESEVAGGEDMHRQLERHLRDGAFTPSLGCRGALAASHLSGKHHPNLCFEKEGLAEPPTLRTLQPSQNSGMNEASSSHHQNRTWQYFPSDLNPLSPLVQMTIFLFLFQVH